MCLRRHHVRHSCKVRSPKHAHRNRTTGILIFEKLSMVTGEFILPHLVVEVRTVLGQITIAERFVTKVPKIDTNHYASGRVAVFMMSCRPSNKSPALDDKASLPYVSKR